MRRVVLVFVLAGAAASGAAERGFYFGAGRTSVDASYARDERLVQIAAEDAGPGLPLGTLDSADLKPLGANAWRVMTGYRFLDWLALEGRYDRFAGNTALTGIVCVTQPCPARESADAHSSIVSVLALYPRGPVDLFLKAGITVWSADLEFQNPDGTHIVTQDSNGTDPGFGAGIQYRFSRLALRLEYERAKFGDDAANLYTLGVACIF